MNDDQSPEVLEFFHGQTDELAIQEYLNVKDDGEIARLAAMMAPKRKAFDPAALVDAAIALQTETKAGLIRRRETIVTAMNYSTLLDLQNALGGSLNPFVDDDDEQLCDPIIGPVLRKLQATVSNGMKQSDILDKARIASTLASADTRTKLSRPTLPCDLDDALRYATNSPKVHWQSLKGAFVDFLGIFRTSREQEQRDENEESLRNQIEHTARIIAGLETNLNNDPQKLKSKREHEEHLKRFLDDLISLETVTTYRETFVPGARTPREVMEESSAIFAKYWQEPKSVDSDASLAWFSTEFYAFWNQHGEAYLSIDAAAEKARKAKATKNRKAAQKSAASQARDRWLKHTEDFVTFLRENQSPQSDLSTLLKIFADKHCGLRTEAAQIKVREFLGMLSTYANRDFDTRSIIGSLRKLGIKALSEEAIRECHSLLKATVVRLREKKSEKS
jgi:hypothetical protein